MQWLRACKALLQGPGYGGERENRRREDMEERMDYDKSPIQHTKLCHHAVHIDTHYAQVHMKNKLNNT